MKLTEAASQWKAAKRDYDEAKARMEAARHVLLGWFRAHPRRRTFLGIAYALTHRSVLDTAKVKGELGDRLGEFQRRVPVEILSPAKK